jgi:hypothetical protein
LTFFLKGKFALLVIIFVLSTTTILASLFPDVSLRSCAGWWGNVAAATALDILFLYSLAYWLVCVIICYVSAKGARMALVLGERSVMLECLWKVVSGLLNISLPLVPFVFGGVGSCVNQPLFVQWAP